MNIDWIQHKVRSIVQYGKKMMTFNGAKSEDKLVLKEILRIKLKDENRSPFGPLFIGGNKRLATATGVRFIDDNQVVIANLVGARLYLYNVDISEKKYSITDQTDCLLHSELNYPDLIDFDGTDRIICSYFKPGAVAIFKLSDRKISQDYEIDRIENFTQFCHGVRFHPNDRDLIVTTGNKVPIVNFISLEKRKIIRQITYLPNFFPKDIHFLSTGKLMVVYTSSLVTKKGMADSNISSHVVMYNVNEHSEKIISVYEQAECHADSICQSEDLIFLGDQNKNKVYVLKLEEDSLLFLKEEDGFDFPHGLDARRINQQIILAVTNYGDNTVRFLDVKCHEQEMKLLNN